MARIKESTVVTRKSALRKVRAAGKTEAKAKPTKAVKTNSRSDKREGGWGEPRRRHPPVQTRRTPAREQFQLVYGERGHLMTWEQRAKAGVSAKQFQAALAAKQSGRKDAKPSIPALTVKD